MDPDVRCCRRRLHARLPGRALADRRARCRGRPATIIRPRSRPARSRPRTATSISPRPAARSTSASANDQAPELLSDEPITRPPRRGRRTAMCSTRRSNERLRASAAPNGSRNSTKPACPAGPIYKIDEMFADPQVKHLGIAATVAGSTIRLVGQPVIVVAHAVASGGAPAGLGQQPTPCLKSSASPADQGAA